MKTVPFYGLLALFLLPVPLLAFQQPTVNDAAPERCETAHFHFGYHDSDSFVELMWNRPAKFPQPSTIEVEDKDFAINCQDFSANRSGGTFRIRAKTLDAAYRRLGPVYVFYMDGWLYPNIKEDFFIHSIRLVVAQSSLTLEHDGDTGFSSYFFGGVIIGAKVNDGDLEPLFFEGKAIPLSFNQTDKVDVFAKMTAGSELLGRKQSAKVSKLTIDARNGEIIIYSSAPFPDK